MSKREGSRVVKILRRTLVTQNRQPRKGNRTKTFYQVGRHSGKTS